MIDRPLRWTARSLSLYLLLQVRRKEAFVQELMDDAFRDVPLSAADRRLTTQLVSGTLRRRAALDTLLRQVVNRPHAKVETVLWEALRLGAFQLAYLSRMPSYSVVHETVELAVDFGLPRAKGFLNGNLRALTRLLTSDVVDAPGAAALPLSAGQYRRLTEAVFPEPRTQPVEYVAAGLSLPGWLAKRWADRWGAEELARLGFWFADPPPLWLRVNPLRTTREAYMARLQEAGIAASAGDHPQAVRLDESHAIRDLPGYGEGHFVVQDISAMNVASALDPQPGWRVLDLCAAPGTKSTHLAELMRNEGEIIACDRDAARLASLAPTMHRLGLTCIKPYPLFDGEAPPAGPFDAVLVDVPCSNTGVLGRRPEARWRLNEIEFQRLTPLQTRLLQTALARVKPGGLVVYSTCSIEPEENERLVANLLGSFPPCASESHLLSMPGNPGDGGFWTRLRANAIPPPR